MQGGVCVEMPISEAKSLLRHGGEFHVFEHDPDADAEAIEGLADSLENFSPIVGSESVDEAEYKRGRRPHALLLDVTGLAHLFGDEHQLARQLLQHCDKLGYLPRVAIADTVGIAWATAHYFAGHYFAQHQQPAVLPPGDQETWKQFPVASLRLPATITDTLAQLGIGNIGQLQRLPRNDLAMRFGDTIHRRLDQLMGTIEEPVIARRKPAEFISNELLEYPTHHRETIEVITARLVTQLCEQMRVRQQGALQWIVQLACQAGPPLQFHVNLFQPTATTAQVMPLMEMQLEQVLSPHTKKVRKKKRATAKKPIVKRTEKQGAQKAADSKHLTSTASETKDQSSPSSHDGPTISLESQQFHRYTTIQVNEITVSVTSSVLLAQQQRQLFDENPRLDRQSLAHLINRLANRLGTQNVVYPALQSGAQPEYSFRLRPLVDPSRKRRRRKTKSSQQSHVRARPLRLFHPPLALKQASLLTTGTSTTNATNTSVRYPSDSPALLCLESSQSSGQQYSPAQKIVASWGPERIETGWWRGRTVCRDYWRVETETQQQFWVYRNLRNGNWFLHGEF